MKTSVKAAFQLDQRVRHIPTGVESTVIELVGIQGFDGTVDRWLYHLDRVSLPAAIAESDLESV